MSGTPFIEYRPYGGILSGGTESKHLYTGQEYDHSTGLNYYKSRYYQPHIQRFIQPDSIIPDAYDPQQLNPYAYVRNNPVKYVDPDGNIAQIALALWVALDYGISGYDYYQEQKIINNPESTPEEIKAAKSEQNDIIAYEFMLEPDEVAGMPVLGAIDDVARGSKTLKKAGKKAGDFVSQNHHLIPWNNNSFKHFNHPMIKEAGINLKTYTNNILGLANHKGRHSSTYHQSVNSILDQYFHKLHKGEYENAKDALDAAIGRIRNDISSGDLKLYKNKDVWEPQ